MKISVPLEDQVSKYVCLIIKSHDTHDQKLHNQINQYPQKTLICYSRFPPQTGKHLGQESSDKYHLEGKAQVQGKFVDSLHLSVPRSSESTNFKRVGT